MEEAMKQVTALLTSWLLENTIEVFEERPEIDNARTLLLEALSRIESK